MGGRNLKTDNLIVEKSKALALRIIKLYKYLCGDKNEYILSKQIMRSGTSIGANVREATRAQSKADFHTKIAIALKEAEETAYWLELLFESDYLETEAYNSIYSDCNEVCEILMSISKTGREDKCTMGDVSN